MSLSSGGGWTSPHGNWQPPLFRIGKLPLNVTGLVILLQVIGMLALVISPKLFENLAFFSPKDFQGGAVWQVVSYPFFMPPDIWLILGMYFFFRFGGMVEASLGRRKYVHLLLAVMVIPPVTVLCASLLGIDGGLLGSHLPNLAVFVAAISMMPNAPMMYFGFPIKWLAVAFVGIAFLQFAMGRNWGACLALVTVVYFALWWMRQAGHVSQWGVVEDVWGPKKARPQKKKSKSQKKKSYEKKLKPRTKVNFSQDQKIDKILDKINEHGLHSLTEEERKILQEAGKR